jgi:hypothetical protein
LDEVVPVGCIVVSFVSFINTRQNETRFREISAEFVENAEDWRAGKCKVYVIQKQ